MEPTRQQSEVYIKRWEPQEEFRGSVIDGVVDALCEAFSDERERRQAVWFDDRNFYEFFPLQTACMLRKAC